MKKPLTTWFCIILCASVLAGCAKAAAPESKVSKNPASNSAITLKIATWLPQAMPPPINWDPFDYMYNAWCDNIEKETGNRVVFERYPAETLIKMTNMMDAVRQGVVDVVVVHPPAEPRDRFAFTSLLELPNLFPNSVVGSLVTQRLFEEGYFDSEWQGVKVLFNAVNYPADIASSTRPIKTLEDFKGLKIGVMGEPEISTLKALGALPVEVPVTKQYAALETGMIDAFSLELHGQVAFKFYRVSNYFTKCHGCVRLQDVCMNIKTWNSLPPDIQEIINKNSGELWSLMTAERFEANFSKAVSYIEDYNRIRNLPPIYYPPAAETARWDNLWNSVYESQIAEVEAEGLPARQMVSEAKDLVARYTDYHMMNAANP